MAFIWFKLCVCNYRCAEHWALLFLISLLLLRKAYVPRVLTVWGGNLEGASRAEVSIWWNLQSTWGKTCGCYFDSEHHSNCLHWHGSCRAENLCICINSKLKPECIHPICKNRVWLIYHTLWSVTTLVSGVSAACVDVI